VAGLETEAVAARDLNSDGVQQTARQVDHGPASAALRVHVLWTGRGFHKVVRGRAVTHVDMPDDTEFHQRFQGSVHRGAVHSWHLGLDLGAQLLGRGMAAVRGEDVDDGTPRDGHPVAGRTQPVEGVITSEGRARRGVGSRAHGSSLPTRQRRRRPSGVSRIAAPYDRRLHTVTARHGPLLPIASASVRVPSKTVTVH